MVKLWIERFVVPCKYLLLLKIWVCLRYVNSSTDCKGVCC